MDINSVMKFRTKLIEYGKRVSIENPDRLNDDELQALTVRIFDILNKLDMSLGYDNHDTGIRMPKSTIAFLRRRRVRAQWIPRAAIL